MLEGKGCYLGTEIECRWWRRQTGHGLFMRGNGSWSIREDGLWFLRLLTRTPMEIPLSRVARVDVGTWHAGKWLIRPVAVKLVWTLDGREVCSGFVLSKSPVHARELAEYLSGLAGRARGTGGTGPSA